MTTGVRLYNKSNQTMISSKDICFGLSQKLIAVDDLNGGARWGKYVWLAGTTGCISPLIVYELNDVSTRVQVLSGTSNATGFDIKVFTVGTRGLAPNLYVFDIASVARLEGQCVFRMYREDGELAFDNRIRNLEVVGEVVDGMVLDANKKYGVLLRSSPSYVSRSDSRRSGPWVYEREQEVRELVWREGNILRHQEVQILDRELKFAAESYGPTGPMKYEGYAANKSLASPLLIDLTLIKSLE